ncbi:hypothetical protein K470DRAFT_209144 [Piedraia hortae CBS 480.64]|uniref:SPX domain-containing protein n=1 Tax=Piedraia hortae CBS 480.64 TaxID=1314780 RepID=A0A6A7C9R4_9PEZI|nr:hypothetical protein K470DRAFT_209144 [Piedraia hortae CBS 480.64]
MKYGDTLRQRSIPAWSHHNIDYDDIKHMIKQQTADNRSRVIPGCTDVAGAEFEEQLFDVLVAQHERIYLFVKSKAGEIRRRHDHAQQQFQQLVQRSAAVADVSVRFLERYGRLESEVMKVGDDIRALARFASTQRTAFRKLLKKYGKWSGSRGVEDRFRDEVMWDPKGLFKINLQPLFDDYSRLLEQIRSRYEKMLQPSAETRLHTSKYNPAITQLQAAMQSGSKVDFDTALATVPLGPDGTCATYFVHPEALIELQVLLLQYCRYLTAQTGYHVLEAGHAETFAREQAALTVDEREHCPGLCPQKAQLSVRWAGDEDAKISFRTDSGFQYERSKQKHVGALFSSTCSKLPQSECIQGIQHEAKSGTLKPMHTISSLRARLIGMDSTNNAVSLVAATIDTKISIKSDGQEITKFPYAILWVRQEGVPLNDLVTILNHTHLTERIRGFSLGYYAMWMKEQTTGRSSDLPAPFWLPLLHQDIRKPPKEDQGLSPSASLSQTGADTGTSASTTIKGSDTFSSTTDAAIAPGNIKKPQRQRNHQYWSEYDDQETAQEPYTILIDPDYKSPFERFFTSFTDRFFSPRHSRKPGNNVDSDAAEPLLRCRSESSSLYGSIQSGYSSEAILPSSHRNGGIVAISFTASMVILAVGYILAATGRHRLEYEVDFGIIVAVASSLFFAILGSLAAFMTRRGRHFSRTTWLVVGMALCIVILGSAGLVAWVLTRT